MPRLSYRVARVILCLNCGCPVPSDQTGDDYCSSRCEDEGTEHEQAVLDTDDGPDLDW